MTHDQAIVVRTLQLQGEPVNKELLAKAIEVIRTTRTATPWPTYGEATPEREPTPGQQWKCGDEFLPFHPQASHVPAEYRDGWNRCYAMARTRIMGGQVVEVK